MEAICASSKRTLSISENDAKKKCNRPTSLDAETLLADAVEEVQWIKVGEGQPNLNLEYRVLFRKETADAIFESLEDQIEYFTGALTKIKVYGKWCDIPRKQATFGDEGLTYKYSGIITPANPWPPILASIRAVVAEVTGYHYNFVLVNRYKDGTDRVGEHRDDERDLDENTPIASVSFGQPREFYFKHADSRLSKRKPIDKVSLILEHGSLLLMKYPTNRYWYHALPPRKAASKPRINLTFRKIITRKNNSIKKH